MAAASLLALLDDIASVLDDVSVLTQAATKKTAGVLGDDLALNAQQVAGLKANRELPVVWAVAKGSLVNKAILVPAALAISAVAPWAIVPLLMAGGLYLCFEGFEKIWHLLVHRAQDDEHRQELREAIVDPAGRPASQSRRTRSRVPYAPTSSFPPRSSSSRSAPWARPLSACVSRCSSASRCS